ncbi:MAG: TIGR00269 family protein [Candidatus Bathyarchaeota archaeon]|nr:TIGR00269 family protein [Candidatus Bathyarchaeota archaeon]
MTAPTCTKCHERPSVFHRAYSGERLCPACFKSSLKERVQGAINRFRMLDHWSRVAVALSGGKDSLTLLHILKEIEDETHGSDLIAITVDEGIAGYRDEAVGIAERACRRLGVEWRLVSFRDLFGRSMDEIAAEDRVLGACTFCGVLRRRALNEAARQAGADRLATGHTLDDMAQSALLNLLRGDVGKMATLDPGGSTSPGFVRRIKPLCEVPERETALYAYLGGFELQGVTCPYAGEAMRGDARAFLSQMEARRPGTLFTTYNTALKLIPATSAQAMKTCTICGEPSTGDTCRVCQLLPVRKTR